MSHETVTAIEQEIHYFGKVSASVSHELKNVLAILNEHAGLLQDFASMAEQGQPIDQEKIRRIADNMLMQINRGDQIIKRMNRFAHTADESFGNVNLTELLKLVADMFERTATTRGIKITLNADETELPVLTRPFVLETLLGTLFDRLSDCKLVSSELVLSVKSAQDHVQVQFTGLTNQDNMMTDIMKSDHIRVLVGILNIQIHFTEQSNELLLLIPIKIE